MRRVNIFSGSSHPLLAEAICDRLGTSLANCELKKFSNGETSVSVNTSIRNQDVFIVQSGSSKINDSLMELLIMISACKGGSAKSITAVMPYFPYSRQSKKKSHRGAIAARMVANLLFIAGVHHVITVDLHAPPTQGFFHHPIDNLHAEPLIARWIRNNVPGWKEAVVVSKNPGGSKRVTSLADALKLNFGIVTTDRRRAPLNGSSGSETSGFLEGLSESPDQSNHHAPMETDLVIQADGLPESDDSPPQRRSSQRMRNGGSTAASPTHRPINSHVRSSPLFQSSRIDSQSPPSRRAPRPLPDSVVDGVVPENDSADEYTDERARDVITGRLIQGHIVDDDYPSPVLSTMSGSVATLPGDTLGPPHFDDRDPMASSIISTASANQGDHFDAAAASDDEEKFENPELEHTVTLVGNVKDKVVLIMDDLIDHCGSWVAAAETMVKKGGAKKVYCVATHGLFGEDSLEMMEKCQCIDFIVVTNSYPIDPDRIRASNKLVVLDISYLLSEAIRCNHYGESISQLYQNYQD